MVMPHAGPRKSHTIRMPEELYGLVTAKAAQTGKTINDVCVDALVKDTSDVGEAPPPKGWKDEIFTVQVPDDMLQAAVRAVGTMDAPAWLRERMRRGMQLERGINASIDIAASRMAAAALPAPDGVGAAAAPADAVREQPESPGAPETEPDAPAAKPKKRRWWRRKRGA